MGAGCGCRACGLIRWLFACLIAAPVAAQEYIVTNGPLSDVDFYGIVSCSAIPGQGCSAPVVRWSQPVVTVTFAPIPNAYPSDLAKEFSDKLDTSIGQINGATAGVDLRRVPKSQYADVLIYLQPIRAGEGIQATRFSDLNGVPIGAAQVQIHWDERRHLTEAVIVMGADIPLEQAGAILLEELTQSMGLMTDIKNPYYDTRSVFSEDSNSVQKLGAQDRAALATHYPDT